MGVWCGKKNPLLGITVRHHSASLVMQISDPRDRLFHPHHTPTNDPYILSNLRAKCVFMIYLIKKLLKRCLGEKELSQNMYTLRCVSVAVISRAKTCYYCCYCCYGLLTTCQPITVILGRLPAKLTNQGPQPMFHGRIEEINSRTYHQIPSGAFFIYAVLLKLIKYFCDIFSFSFFFILYKVYFNIYFSTSCVRVLYSYHFTGNASFSKKKKAL